MFGIGYQELLLLFLIWLPFACVVAYVARQKGRSDGGWALLSIFITPVLALIALAALPAIKEKDEERIERFEAELDPLRPLPDDESTRPPWARPRPRGRP